VKRWFYLIHGVFVYLASAVAVIYFALFLGNVMVPKTVDIGTPTSPGTASIIDVALLLIFGLQHSVMARRSFKIWWTKLVPQPIERSTYVLASSAALLLLCWLWRPIPSAVWNITIPIIRWTIHVVAVLGAVLAIGATFAIDHFELLGLRQVWNYWRSQIQARGAFVTPGPYRFVRHPIMLGILVAFWSVPMMTAGHLLFVFAMTAYILIAIQFEERDLVREFGDDYLKYRRRVWMLFPLPQKT
jgi:protein-S-isoprenylcysteine O-methyltransferase Ste14